METSGKVREAFRAKGHDAVSCDLLPADDDSPHHIQGDVFDELGKPWDLLIAHPTCTYLSVSGLHWNTRLPGRAHKTEAALADVRRLMEANIEKICIENPVGCISSKIRKPDQIVQPYEFGHDASKKTCLWLKGLPKLPLDPAKYVRGKSSCGKHIWDGKGNANPWERVPECPVCGGHATRTVWGNQTPSGQNKLGPSPDRWKKRAETYSGIAEAMADTWGRA
jgi:hypothetical protein